MRPARFQSFMLDLVKNHSTATGVRSLAEAGDSKHPFGLAITTSAGEARWQFIGQLADGERHSSPEVPVEGEPLPAEPGRKRDESPESWLAELLASSESREIESFEFSGSALVVRFYNGSRIYARRV